MSERATHHSILRTEVLTDGGRKEVLSLRVYCKRRGHSLPLAECMGCPRLEHAHLSADLEVASIDCDDTSGVMVPEDVESEPVGALLRGNVCCIPDDATLQDVTEGLVSIGMDDAPVVDPDGRYFGVIRDSGLVGARKGDVVKDVLTRAAAVSENDTVYEAVVRMARTHQRDIPVLSGDGVVVGVLRDVDAIRWLTQDRGDR